MLLRNAFDGSFTSKATPCTSPPPGPEFPPMIKPALKTAPPTVQTNCQPELFHRESPKYPLTSLRPRPYVAVPRSAPVPGGPSRYRTTLSTPGVLPEEFRSMAQPQTTSVPSKTVEFAAGPST